MKTCLTLAAIQFVSQTVGVIPLLLVSRVTPRTSGTAEKVSSFQDVEYADQDSIKNAFFKNKYTKTSLLQTKA